LLRQYGGAAAAYSLQRLDTSVDNVVRARRSTDDAEADFTAQEVSGGSLREFSLNNDADLIRFADQATAADKRMYFDGAGTRVNLTIGDGSGNYFGGCTISATVYVADPSATLVVCSYGGAAYRIITTGGLWGLAGTTTGASVTGGLQDVSADFDASGGATALRIDGITVWTGSGAPGVGNTVFQIGARNSGLSWKGLIYDFSLSGSTVKNFAFNGYGNTDADWVDTTGGGNDGTVVGSPALFSGQGFDAFVTTLYDQSGALGQPLSRFAQHATAADTRMQFDGVDDSVTGSDTGFPTGADERTLEATFVATTAGTYSLIAYGSENIRQRISLELDSSGNIGVTCGSSNIFKTTTVSVYDGQPHTAKVVVTSSGDMADFEFYVDGVQMTSTASSASTGVVNTTLDQYSVGALINASKSERFLNGVVYDARIKNAAGTTIFQLNGYGNTNADWTDQVGSNDGTVNGSPSIYEGRNATQATAASQPQIVSSGSVVTDANGKPCITNQTANSSIGLDYPIPARNTYWEMYLIYQAASGQTQGCLLSDGDNGAAIWGIVQDASASNTGAAVTGDTYRKNGSAISSPTRDDLHTQLHDGGANLVTAYATHDDNPGWDGSDVSFFQYGGSPTQFSALCKYCEMIVYQSDQSSNRAAIEANIAARYGITLA